MATPERMLIDTSALYAIYSDSDLFHRTHSSVAGAIPASGPSPIGEAHFRGE